MMERINTFSTYYLDWNGIIERCIKKKKKKIRIEESLHLKLQELHGWWI